MFGTRSTSFVYCLEEKEKITEVIKHLLNREYRFLLIIIISAHRSLL